MSRNPACPYTPEQCRLCDLFEARMKARRLTEAEAGAEIGYTAGSVSSLLSGLYGANPAHILKKIKTLLEAEAREAADVRPPEFAELETVRAIHGYCCQRRDGHRMGYICGAPGIGRTIALTQFDVENDNLLYVAVPPGITPAALLRSIARALKLDPGRLTRLALRDLLIAALAKLHGGLLIIDEADRMNLDVADTARDLWDASRCGQVWSGTQKLLQYLDSHYDSIAGQVRRRLGDVLYLPFLDRRDLEAILAQYPDWPDDLRELAIARARGNTDRLCQAIRAARTVVAGGVPTPRHLGDAFKALE